MKNFKLELETAYTSNEETHNGKAIINYVEISGHTVAILGFYFKGLAEARVDFATFNSEGVELPSDTQGNTFGVKDVMTIMHACKSMSQRLISQHNPERIAYIGAEAKRFSLYQRMARKIGEGKKVWVEEETLTVWLELFSEWE